MQRNDLLTSTRKRSRVFVLPSTELLPSARAVQSTFEHDNVTVEVWTDGVFRPDLTIKVSDGNSTKVTSPSPSRPPMI